MHVINWLKAFLLIVTSVFFIGAASVIPAAARDLDEALRLDDQPTKLYQTLSACDTALAKIRGGDDLVGLSRGFIYAGAPSLLATLWEVDDQSTAILDDRGPAVKLFECKTVPSGV